MSTKSTGNAAEYAVAEFIKEKGYEIVELNWRNRIAEIDIVAKKQNKMYFIEVKYRQSDSAGDGFDYITSKKLHHMQRAAEAWVVGHDWQKEYELLAAAVTKNNGHFQIDIRELV